MSVTAKTKICMVIGDPVEHSMSPVMHNAGYSELGIDSDFVYVACAIKPEDLELFVKAIRIMNLRGVSCTAPHKTYIAKYLDEIDPVAEQIGAVNTIVNTDGILRGYNTDWLGIVDTLEQRFPLAGKKVALIGAGGAGRAAAYGLNLRQAELTIYNRTLGNADKLVATFGGKAASLQDLAGVQSADVIINTVPAALAAEEIKQNLVSYIKPDQTVFDIAYGPGATELLSQAKQKGAQVIGGLEMLLYQGVEQFKLYTAMEAPVEAMRNALVDSIKIKTGS